ncbi:MAG TPA: hypothetical protein VH116_06390 [Gemmatimonadales bacterium]|nr:hypothetical protein [Gemmatimonadales bacterium]
MTLVVQVGDPPPLDADDRPVFHQPDVLIRSGPPHGTLTLSWERAPALAEIAPGTQTARVTLSRLAVARLQECTCTFFMAVLIFLLRRAGWHHVHAGTAIDPAGRGWLIAGDSGAGKSTTAALFASHGWQVGTDDATFLAPAGAQVAAVAYRAPIALRPDAQRALGRSGGIPVAGRRKAAYWPEDLGGRWAPKVEPEIVAFTSVGEGPTRAARLGARAALAQLVRWSAWVVLEPDLAQEHLDLLARLARQARSYRVSLGPDLFTDVAGLPDLVR